MKKFSEWIKVREMAGTDAIVNSCRPGADYQVWGACSDLKKKKKHGKRKQK